jgi:DNA polymerase sigma
MHNRFTVFLNSSTPCIARYRPLLLAVENPQSAGVDMGRNSFLMPRVKKAFDHAHRVLLHCLTRRRDGEAILTLIINADDPALTSRSTLDRTICVEEEASEEDVSDIDSDEAERRMKKEKKKQKKRNRRESRESEQLAEVSGRHSVSGGGGHGSGSDTSGNMDEAAGGHHKSKSKSQTSRKRRKIADQHHHERG